MYKVFFVKIEENTGFSMKIFVLFIYYRFISILQSHAWQIDIFLFFCRFSFLLSFSFLLALLLVYMSISLSFIRLLWYSVML